MPRILGATVAATLAICLLAPTAAHADRWTSTDPSGDVRGGRHVAAPAPCGTDTELDGSAETNEDITGVTVAHTRDAVVMRIRFTDLLAEHDQNLNLAIHTPKTKYEYFLFREDPRAGHWSVHALLFVQPHYPDPAHAGRCGSFGFITTGVRCRVDRAFGFGRDVIRLRFPRTCFGNPRWVRTGVRASSSTEDPRFSDYYTDEWDNGGVEVSPWLPPLGPRVAAPDSAPVGGEHPGGGAFHFWSRHP